MNYQVHNDTVSFSQSKMPVLFFVILAQLGVYIDFTGNKLLPYKVVMSESDFLSTIELSKEI